MLSRQSRYGSAITILLAAAAVVTGNDLPVVAKRASDQRVGRVKPGRAQTLGDPLDNLFAVEQPRIAQMRMQPIESEPLRGRQRARYRGELLVVSW
jgi:hypothetical protein